MPSSLCDGDAECVCVSGTTDVALVALRYRRWCSACTQQRPTSATMPWKPTVRRWLSNVEVRGPFPADADRPSTVKRTKRCNGKPCTASTAPCSCISAGILQIAVPEAQGAQVQRRTAAIQSVHGAGKLSSLRAGGACRFHRSKNWVARPSLDEDRTFPRLRALRATLRGTA